MTMDVIEWVADFLTTDDEFLIPVKKLWLIAQSNRLATNLSLEKFYCLLKGDDRFDFDEGIDFGEGFEDPEAEREIMESIGYFSGPRVRLAAREITLDMIAEAIERSTDRMMTALESAWETRDLDDEEAETNLLDLLAKGQLLQRGLDEMLGNLSDAEEAEESGQP